MRDAPEISVSGDPFAELDDARPSAERRAIGELHKGGERLIAYTEGGRCGLLVTRSGNEKGPVLSLDTAMPKSDDQGSSKMPAGPYLKSSATGSGASKPWASMSCGKNAMVIEYSSHGTGNPSKPRGSVSTAEGPEGSHSLFVAVGEEGARKKILSALPPGP
ncbi:hypothetical protein [Streptomyces sp. NPDC059900]|uniref:hypothetical protein n=1 Tax=Streptomyces sp. NPDC059900 TaxID=3155816 RepID=UPI003D04000F